MGGNDVDIIIVNNDDAYVGEFDFVVVGVSMILDVFFYGHQRSSSSSPLAVVEAASPRRRISLSTLT